MISVFKKVIIIVFVLFVIFYSEFSYCQIMEIVEVNGTIKYFDSEGGFYGIVADNGKQYAEQGLPERTILKSLGLKNHWFDYQVNWLQSVVQKQAAVGEPGAIAHHRGHTAHARAPCIVQAGLDHEVAPALVLVLPGIDPNAVDKHVAATLHAAPCELAG